MLPFLIWVVETLQAPRPEFWVSVATFLLWSYLFFCTERDRITAGKLLKRMQRGTEDIKNLAVDLICDYVQTIDPPREFVPPNPIHLLGQVEDYSKHMCPICKVRDSAPNQTLCIKCREDLDERLTVIKGKFESLSLGGVKS